MIRQGNQLEIGIGMEMAGMPKAVYGARLTAEDIFDCGLQLNCCVLDERR